VTVTDVPRDRPEDRQDQEGRPNTEIGYAAAVAELDTILRELEDDDVDVDVLTARVRRASELVKLCRDRISATKIEVAQIVADLDTGPAPELDGSSSGGGEVW